MCYLKYCGIRKKLKSRDNFLPLIARSALALSCSTKRAVARKNPPPITQTKTLIYNAYCKLIKFAATSPAFSGTWFFFIASDTYKVDTTFSFKITPPLDRN